MSLKRQNPDTSVGGPPEKMLCTQSNIEFTMLNRKFKTLEADWRDRGNKLSTKQKELNDTRKQMEELRAEYEEQIKRLNLQLSFRNEEVNANHFKDLGLNSFKENRKDHNKQVVIGQEKAGQSLKVLQSIGNVPRSESKENTERDVKTKALMMNLLVRRLSFNSRRKNQGPNLLTQYKIENDTKLPCNLNPSEMAQRFESICNFRKKHPAQCSTFENYRIPNRQEVLNSEVFETDDLDDRISIWTALHANEERFLCHDSSFETPKLRQMHLLGKNMEYQSVYAVNRNSFENLSATNFKVPQWFSRFYV